MSSPTDQQLVQYIGQGRRDALAQLFDRYSADLYDYLARLVGDRDQAARLLDQVMLRVPGAVAGFQPRDSVRGWLYSLSREAGLDWLRQRGWLDGLPPSDEPIQPGLQGDVWRAARAMPGFFRAVLITEELQPLSPSEKARALGVNRTDLPRLIEEARKSFNRTYDAQARAEGRPTSDRINTDTVWNARRRLPVEGGSLFGFLPLIEFPESLKQQIRRHVLDASAPPPAGGSGTKDAALGAAAAVAAAGVLNNQSAAPTNSAALSKPSEPPPSQGTAQNVPPKEPPPPVKSDKDSGLRGVPMTAIAALVGVALALLICAAVFLLTQNRGIPTITSVQPADGSTILNAPTITVYAVYESSRDIDLLKSAMLIDGIARQFQIVDSRSIVWSGPLQVGTHNVQVTLVDSAGSTNSNPPYRWVFSIAGEGTIVPTPNGGVASVTPIMPIGTGTPGTPLSPQDATGTAQAATVTPIVVVGTPTPIIVGTPTVGFVTLTPVPNFPTSFPTQCTRGGLSGVVFNDLNGNGVREPNDPGLASVSINLVNQFNSIVSVTASDAFGNYRFGDVPFGNYRVVANTPSGFFPTTATSINAFIGGCATVTGFNFGFGQNPVISPTFTFTPPPLFGVINGSAFVTPSFSTTCPQNFTFNGTLTTNGAGSVQYRWVRSDGTIRPIQTLPFAFAGTQNVVPDVWTLGSDGSGWARIEVLSPNIFTSPQANFTLSCGVPTTITPSITPSITPTYTPTLPPFAVTNVTSSVSPNSSTTCPETFTFNGTITTNNPGNVTYQWVRSDGGTSPPAALTFLVAGTQNVTPETWTLGVPGFNFNGWEKIQVLSPNSISSPQANFTLNCPPPTLSPTPTPTNTPLPPSQVTNVTLGPAAPLVLAACPGVVNFSGQITTNGPTNVTYEWEQSDGTTIGPSVINFPGPGTQNVNHAWNFGAGPIILNGLWARINVLSPNVLSSTQATFDVNCP